jgi:hypothetical protein
MSRRIATHDSVWLHVIHDHASRQYDSPFANPDTRSDEGFSGNPSAIANHYRGSGQWEFGIVVIVARGTQMAPLTNSDVTPKMYWRSIVALNIWSKATAAAHN